MIQIDIVLKSHYWYSTMGVQYTFCPRALFSRNAKQGFYVQEPAEYGEMGCFIFSSYSVEIWLSHENVSTAGDFCTEPKKGEGFIVILLLLPAGLLSVHCTTKSCSVLPPKLI